MPSEMFLRVSDTVLALFWAFVLIRTLSSGYIFGRNASPPDRKVRPGQYWFMVFIFALMVIHFGGLAWVGQKLS